MSRRSVSEDGSPRPRCKIPHPLSLPKTNTKKNTAPRHTPIPHLVKEVMTTSTNEQNTDSKQAALEQIEAFEAGYRYDCSYMKSMLEHAPEALEVFNGFTPMAGHRLHAPLEVYFAAKLTAYRYADCGPCLQLAIRFAQEAGVSNKLIETLVFDRGELSELLALTQTFTHACLANSSNCETLRTELSWEIGPAAMIELALVIAAAQVFPVVKRATGHYKSCSLVTLEV